MKKVIVYPLLAGLTSLGATTGYLVKTHQPEPVAVDSRGAGKDTVAVEGTKVTTARRDSAPADSSHHSVTPDSAAHALVTAGQPVREAAATAVSIAPPPVRPAARLDPVAKAAAYKQVARVLSAMKPAEAAKVLAYLSDDEVEGILRAVGPRQAADFLSNIPKERAAGLSRRLLVPKEQGR